MSRSSLSIGTIYLTISSLFFLVSGYLLNVWLGRFLGPEKYGTYGIIIALVTILTVIQSSGIPHAVTKFVSEKPRFAKAILFEGLLLQGLVGLFFMVVFLAFPRYIADLFNDHSLAPYIQLCSILFPINAFYTIYLGYNNGRHDFRAQALMSIAYAIGKVILIIPLAFFLGIKGVIYGSFFATLLGLFLGLHSFKFSRSIYSYKQYLIFGVPILGFAIFSNLQNSVDLFLIKSLTGSDLITGYYTASQNIARIPFYTFSAIGLVVYPGIARSMGKNDRSQAIKIIKQSLKLTLVLSIPLILLISATSYSLVTLIYSQEYLAASQSLSILVLAFGFLTIFSLFTNVLNGSGEPMKTMWTSVLGILITIVLGLILIPHFGLIGASLATTIGSFFITLIAAYFVYRKFNALINPVRLLKILSSGVVIFIVARVIPVVPMLLPILYFFLFAIYLFLLYFLKEITSEDWKQIRPLIPAWVPFVN